VQPGGVKTLVTDDDQHRLVADRVNRHGPAAASRHGFAQRALADLAGHALREGQPGSSQCGEVIWVRASGVLPDNQTVPAGHGRPGNPGHLLLERTHLCEHGVFDHLRSYPLVNNDFTSPGRGQEFRRRSFNSGISRSRISRRFTSAEH
jgi:hypothetical protein